MGLGYCLRVPPEFVARRYVGYGKKEGHQYKSGQFEKKATTKDHPTMVDVIIKGYKGNILWLINEVRVAKQLFWVSDLVQASMGEVNGDMWGTGVRRNIVQWYRSAPFSNRMVGIWEDMVKYVYLGTPNRHPNDIMVDLGRWYSKRTDQWVWDEYTEGLFFCTKDGWERWTYHQLGRRRQ